MESEGDVRVMCVNVYMSTSVFGSLLVKRPISILKPYTGNGKTSARDDSEIGILLKFSLLRLAWVAGLVVILPLKLAAWAKIKKPPCT